MKQALVGTAFILCACGSSQVNNTMPSAPDTGTSEVSDAGPESLPTMDAEDKEVPYQPCVTSFSKPVTYGSADAQKCLVERYCTSSYGDTYLDDLWDNCHLLACQWKLGCQGLKIYCLPDAEQSSPTYADDQCTQPMAMVPVKGGLPVTNYIGLDTTASNADAGPDADWSYCVSIYTLAGPWADDGIMYYLFRQGSNWNCTATGYYPMVPGFKFYYINPTVVDLPSNFVAQ